MRKSFERVLSSVASRFTSVQSGGMAATVEEFEGQDHRTRHFGSPIPSRQITKRPSWFRLPKVIGTTAVVLNAGLICPHAGKRCYVRIT